MSNAKKKAEGEAAKAPEEVQTGTAVTEAKVTAVAVPTDMDYGEDSGAGMEGITNDERRLPFIRILQSNSPAVADNLIEGAKAGMLHNTATNEVYDQNVGLPFIPVYRDHNFIEYVPRDNGGGFVAIWAPDDKRIPALRAKQGKYGKLVLDNGNELVETYYLYGLIAAGYEAPSQTVLAFASTQIKKYQMMVTRLNDIKYKVATDDKGGFKMVVPPIWAHWWVLKTQGEQNKKGKYHGWNIGLKEEPANKSRLSPSDPFYAFAKQFYESIKAGTVKVDYEAAANAGKDGDGEAGDAPF